MPTSHWLLRKGSLFRPSQRSGSSLHGRKHFLKCHYISIMIYLCEILQGYVYDERVIFELCSNDVLRLGNYIRYIVTECIVEQQQLLLGESEAKCEQGGKAKVGFEPTFRCNSEIAELLSHDGCVALFSAVCFLCDAAPFSILYLFSILHLFSDDAPPLSPRSSSPAAFSAMPAVQGSSPKARCSAR